jgi:hypothetical protein
MVGHAGPHRALLTQEGTTISPMLIVFGMVLPWVLLAVGCWLFYQLVRQNGRILLRLEAIEKRLGPSSAGTRRMVG